MNLSRLKNKYTGRQFLNWAVPAAFLILIPVLLLSMNSSEDTNPPVSPVNEKAADSAVNVDKAESSSSSKKIETATIGGGCFWCVEAVFERLPGVLDVRSGYTAGHVKNPTYEAVCRGTTGHAEVVQIDFDPEKIAFEQILGIFWQSHDPTTLNRQGADVGTQYRSIILYHNESQKTVAEKSKQQANALFRTPVVTEIVPFEKFYAAEGYHQDYFKNNPNAPYCSIVIKPKLDKLNKYQSSVLK
jgi:peptide-methionine (S)-S-oxide reductase